jgi:hypothetical protein
MSTREPRLPVFEVTTAPSEATAPRRLETRATSVVERAVAHLLGSRSTEERSFTAETWDTEVMRRERMRTHIQDVAGLCNQGFKFADMIANNWHGRVDENERDDLSSKWSNLVDGQHSLREYSNGIRSEYDRSKFLRSTINEDEYWRTLRLLDHLLAPKEPGKGDQGPDAMIALWRRPYVNLIARLHFEAPVSAREISARTLDDDVPAPRDVTWWSKAELARLTLEACPTWTGPSERDLAKRIGDWLEVWKRARDRERDAAHEVWKAGSVAGGIRDCSTITMMPGCFGKRRPETTGH